MTEKSSLTLEKALQENPELKRMLTGEPLSAKQQSSLLYAKAILTVLLAITFIVTLIIVAVSPTNWTLNLQTTTDYRNAATLNVDGYPNIVTPLPIIGYLNIGIVASFVSCVAAIGLGFAWALHGAELAQLSAGANPYVWVFFWSWSWLAFLVIAYLAGIHNVYIQVLIAVAVWCWVFAFWNDDLLNSRVYVATQKWAAGKFGGASMYFSWLTTLFILVPAITVYVVIIIYLCFTFGATAFTGSTVVTGWPIALTLIYLGLYLVNPILYVIYKAGWMSIYTREMVFYIYNGIFVIIISWLTIIAFNFDGITPFFPA